jgi:hypothetical protein
LADDADEVTMAKVFLHKEMAPDRLLGHVQNDGKVYRTDPGLDDRIGHIDFDTGRVYARRAGPDEQVGRVDVDGKIYRNRPGPDLYVARVDAEGRLMLHKSLAADEYVGRVEHPQSARHAGAAALLLVLPALREEPDQDEVSGGGGFQ